MKIIYTKSAVDISTLKSFLEQNLNRLFKERRQIDLVFSVEQTLEGIQIVQPELYETFLFDIQMLNSNANEIHITKSEHYTDDVNVLTLEDIINNLLMEYPGSDNIEHIAEES